MDEQGFTVFMKKKRKAEGTIERCLANARKFEEFLKAKNKTLKKAVPKDLELFVETSIEPKRVSMFMWSIIHYFLFLDNKELLETAKTIRARLITKTRKPFKLKNFRGVKAKHAEILKKHGITDTEKMLEAGKTRKQRKELTKKTGLPDDVILELVKLSDLARLPGVKGIRARLYHDSGLDSTDKLAMTSVEDVLDITREFVEKTGFDGIAPLPKEAKSSVDKSKKLPKIVEW